MPLAYLHETLRRQCTLPAASLAVSSSTSSGSSASAGGAASSSGGPAPAPPAPHELELLAFSSDDLHAIADAVYSYLLAARQRSLGDAPLGAEPELLSRLQRNDFLEHVAAIAPTLLQFLRFIMQQLWIKTQVFIRIELLLYFTLIVMFWSLAKSS